MSNNRHASEESFSRSAGGAALRGAVILVIALVIGILLVRQTGDRNDAPAANDTFVTDTTLAPVDDGADPLVSTTIAPTVRAPEIVKVLVTNGSGVNRAAAKVRAFLVPLRYDLPAPADGAKSNYADFVFFNPGFELEAKEIAAKLGITTPPAVVPVESIVKAPVPPFDVLVMVGPDLAVRYKSQPLTAIAASTTLAP